MTRRIQPMGLLHILALPLILQVLFKFILNYENFAIRE